MNPRFAKGQTLEELASRTPAFIVDENDLLTTQKPSVAYCEVTDKVYFNNVVLPQGGGPVIPQNVLLEDPAI